MARSGEPLTKNLPFVHSRSSSDASSRWAASFLAFSWILRDGDGRCGAGDRRRPRGVGAQAVRRGVGVAVLDLDVRDREAELLGDDLGERRLVALALRLDADPGEDLAGRVDPDLTRVEHLQSEDVEVVRRPGPDDLGERADADAHELAAGPLLGLLPAEVVIADRVEGELERPRIVAGVVIPAGGRVVRELLRLDEVLHPQLGRVLADVVGEDVDHPLDRVDGFRDPERAAVGDAAGRLVGVDAVDLDERLVEVVRAGDHVEQAGRELRRIGRGVAVAVVGDRLDLERLDLAVLRRADLGVDVVVAGERVGLEVLGAVLDPLDRLADEERRRDGENVAGIDRHLAAETAADVVGLDPDVLLGDGQARAAATSARTVRIACGAWLVMWSVSCWRIGSQSATQPQVSIEATWIRGM